MGYEERSDLRFRHLVAPSQDGISSIQPKASQSWPIRMLPSPPQQTDARSTYDGPLESFALAVFVRDFCVPSTDHSVSRGFFDDLPALLEDPGHTSDLAQAAKAVGLAALGNRTSEQAFVQKTRRWYGDVLRSFPRTLSNPKTSSTPQALMTAVLLGLYEVLLPVSTS